MPLDGEMVHHGGDVCVLCVLLAKSLPSGSFLFLLEALSTYAVNHYEGSGGDETLSPREIPVVGIIWKVPSTPTQLPHKYHHHGRAV